MNFFDKCCQLNCEKRPCRLSTRWVKEISRFVDNVVTTIKNSTFKLFFVYLLLVIKYEIASFVFSVSTWSVVHIVKTNFEKPYQAVNKFYGRPSQNSLWLQLLHNMSCSQYVDCEQVVVFDEARSILKTLKSIQSVRNILEGLQQKSICSRDKLKSSHRGNPTVDSTDQLWRVSNALLYHSCTELE